MNFNGFRQSVAILLTVAFIGCTSHTKFRVDDEMALWKSKGWTYLETFGDASNDVVMVSNFSSDNAKKVTAFARISGVATNKVYEQTDTLYLVVSVQEKSGDAFALIFTKPKR